MESCELILTHEVPDSYSHLLFADRGDRVLTSVLLCAMEKSLDIKVEGVVSPRLLDGLNRLQTLWHEWRPKKYSLISISADSYEEAPSNHQGLGLFTFSGGVDSTYSVFHQLSNEAIQPLPVGAAVFVHGADIPLEDKAGFEAAKRRAEKILEGTGIELIPVRTNSRLLGCNWEDSHGLELSACLLLLQSGFGTGVLAGWRSAAEVVYPWGSTPLTDPLASTEAMRIVHDGLERNRIEKIEWLSRHPDVIRHLRVCWEGENRGENCGACEKCVRTLLDFWALGLPSPEAIPTRLSPELIRSIRPSDLDHIEEWKTLLSTASERLDRHDPNLKALRSVVREDIMRIRYRKFRRRLSGIIDDLLGRS